MTITVPGPDGVEVIKEALSDGLAEGKKRDKSTTEIYTLGSPRYKLRIVSPDYKEAEDLLSDILKLVTKTVESGSGTVSFLRK